MILNLKMTDLPDSKQYVALVLPYSLKSAFLRHYNTTLRALLPLPDLAAPPDSAAHLNAYPEFAAGSTVMALYPDTSCFYRAVVIESPTDMARVSC